jgi:3-oxoacyl-[acyl-carrier-protein] synthase III
MAVFLQAPCYVLGEIEAGHESIPGLPERARELALQPRGELWGWGRIHRTERGLEAMAIDAGKSTLQASGLDPSQVDLLVLCSTQFPCDGTTHGSFVETIMTGLGLCSASFMGLTLNRCTNLLAALRTGEALVASGRHRKILLISTDMERDETSRLQGFALFSDGAASCLLSDEGDSGYQVLGSASAQDISTLDWSNEISSDLSRQVNDRLLGPHGLAVGDLSALMHHNIFKPLVVMKERQAGFRPDQLFTGNITRVGHCFAADSLINLVDRVAAGHVPDGGVVMLAGSVPGSRIGVLLRSMPGNAPS